jgi:hypothetical protein
MSSGPISPRTTASSVISVTVRPLDVRASPLSLSASG